MAGPIIIDSRFLAEVEGQRYAIVRLQGPALQECINAQERLKTEIHGVDVMYPTPHLTLCNFRHQASVDDIIIITARWATLTPHFDLKIETIGTFPIPYQVIYAALRRDTAIVHAYETLRNAVMRYGLLGESYAVEHWLPHVSLAYCHRLSPQEWGHAMRVSETLTVTDPSESAGEVDIVAYEQGEEVLVGTCALRVQNEE